MHKVNRSLDNSFRGLPPEPFFSIFDCGAWTLAGTSSQVFFSPKHPDRHPSTKTPQPSRMRVMEGISRGILWPPAPDPPERRQILHWGALRRFFGTVPVRDRGRTLLLP